MRLARYVVKRVVLLAPVLIGILVITFVLIRILPGDPVLAQLSQETSPEQIAAARANLGLDRPWYEQFFVYVGQVLHGDLGNSFQTARPITGELSQHLGPTLELITASFLVALVAGSSLGIYSASRPGRLRDHAVRAGSIAAGSLSEFFLGLVLILVFYYQLGLAPVPRGRFDPATNLSPITHVDIIDGLVTLNWAAELSVLSHLILPVTTLSIVMSPAITRLVRGAAIDVLRSDAYQTAVAHGIGRLARARHYLVRPALSGLPAMAALIYGNALGAVVAVEVVFSWGGLGQWALQGMRTRDYPVVQAFVLVSALVYVLVFLVADVAHAILDPRVEL